VFSGGLGLHQSNTIFCVVMLGFGPEPTVGAPGDSACGGR
jgi:hypothetical protein